MKPDVYNINLLIEGNGKFPDILNCGEYPFLIVSNKVVDLWEESSVSGYIPHEIKIMRKGHKAGSD